MELERGLYGRPKALPDAPPNRTLNRIVRGFDLSEGVYPAGASDALLLEKARGKVRLRGHQLPTRLLPAHRSR